MERKKIIEINAKDAYGNRATRHGCIHAREFFSIYGLVASMKLKSALLHENYANSRVISLEFLSFTLKKHT
jgi:hypothetical protein